MKDFKCPKQYDDPLCPECKHVLPDITTTYSCSGVFNRMLWFKYPYNMSKEMIEKVKTNTVGCLEWKKKNIMTA